MPVSVPVVGMFDDVDEVGRFVEEDGRGSASSEAWVDCSSVGAVVVGDAELSAERDGNGVESPA